MIFTVVHASITMEKSLLERCEEVIQRFQRKVKHRRVTWANQNGEEDQDKARDYLAYKEKIIPSVIRCDKCTHLMKLVGDRYRCNRTGCRREISWKTGTIFFNVRAIKVNQILLIFASIVVFAEEELDLDALATDYSIPRKQATKYRAIALLVLAFWKGRVDYTASNIERGDIRLLPKFLFAKLYQPEDRLGAFFRAFQLWSRDRDPQFPTLANDNIKLFFPQRKRGKQRAIEVYANDSDEEAGIATDKQPSSAIIPPSDDDTSSSDEGDIDGQVQLTETPKETNSPSYWDDFEGAAIGDKHELSHYSFDELLNPTPSPEPAPVAKKVCLSILGSCESPANSSPESAGRGEVAAEESSGPMEINCPGEQAAGGCTESEEEDTWEDMQYHWRMLLYLTDKVLEREAKFLKRKREAK